MIWLQRMYYPRIDGIVTAWEEPNFKVKWVDEKDKINNMTENTKKRTVAFELMEDASDEPVKKTKYGRVVKKPITFGQEMGYVVVFTKAKERFYKELQELQELLYYAPDNIHSVNNEEKDVKASLVGAAEGDAFRNTKELCPMKFNEAMKTEDRWQWDKAVEEEHQKFAKYKVWEEVPSDQIKPNAKILTSTWAMKKKPNRTF